MSWIQSDMLALGERTIPSYVDLKDKNPVPPFEISDNDVFNVDIQMSTGEGIPKAMETRTTGRSTPATVR